MIQPGDDVDVTLTITNHRPEDLTSVVVTDELPDGLTIGDIRWSVNPRSYFTIDETVESPGKTSNLIDPVDLVVLFTKTSVLIGDAY